MDVLSVFKNVSMVWLSETFRVDSLKPSPMIEMDRRAEIKGASTYKVEVG
jgi:hypothetical protein